MDDLEFVQKCVSGDKDSWREFLSKYSRLIYSYIYSVLDIKGYSRDELNVNDVFQDIICSFFKDDFKKLRSFKAKNGCSLASWLRLITINFTIDCLRDRKLRTVSLDDEPREGLRLRDIIMDKKDLQYESAQNNEALKRLTECIERLKTEDKFFLELYINREVSLDAISSVMGISRQATDMRRSRIVKSLRDCFREKGFQVADPV